MAFGAFAVGAGRLATFDSTNRDSNGKIVDAGTISAFSVKVGDCLTGEAVNDQAVDDFRGVPCTDPHLYEVILDTPASSTDFSDAANTQEAESICRAAFQDYVGIPVEESLLTFNFLVPTQESWSAGDRKITCLVQNADDSSLSKSVKNSGM